MICERIYVGSIGTVIRCNCVDDISDATNLVIEARKPNGAVLVWPAVADGPTHCLYVIPDASVIDMPGMWLFQPIVTTPTGQWPGATDRRMIYARFD